MMDNLGGSGFMDPIAAAMQEVDAWFSGGQDSDDPDRRMRMLNDRRYALEVATHEAAHAFWGLRLGLPLKSVSLYRPETGFDFARAADIGDIYRRILKRRISTSMESWLVEVPDLDRMLGMKDDTFYHWLDACKPDYPDEMYEKTTRYKTIYASPKTILVDFPDVHTMQRVVWTDDNPLHRPPTDLELAIMSAIIPVMGPFYGKTWSNLCSLAPDAEITSFTDWLCMDKPTKLHYLHSYTSHTKNRFFWHTSLKMVGCGGSNDYWDILFSDQIVPAPAGDEDESDGDESDLRKIERLLVKERLSGMSMQDVVLATFLSPFNILHPNKAQVMFAIDGLAQALLKGDGVIDGVEANRILANHGRLYTKMKNSPKTTHTPSFLAAERWAALYEQHINRHLSTILHEQFKDEISKGFRKAVDYFNDPKWTPVVAETAYNKYPHENWFTWTDKPFKSGRLTTTKASPLL